MGTNCLFIELSSEARATCAPQIAKGHGTIEQFCGRDAEDASRPAGLQACTDNPRARWKSNEERICPRSNYDWWRLINKDDVDAGIWQNAMHVVARAENYLFPKTEEAVRKVSR